MAWPISQDYNEAIQNPATSFAVADLKGGEVVAGPLGLPLPRSGNFADVYPMIGSDGRKWAIKCFTRQVAGLQERYAKIDAHLNRVKLPFSVGFQFLEQGIRVRGQWYPILKMEWVEGMTLNEFVRQYAEKPLYLRALLGLWLKLSSRLREAGMAHADLQHGNVLLVPGATANKLNLKLIDYDGMWVPALAKLPSGEAGHPAYQHPWRLRDRVYSADVDRFPHLVIACALRATALGGKTLWNTFDNGDNLLFREADFAQPSQSKLLRTLWEFDDPTITNLLALMVLSAQRPLGDTPWVDELLVGESTTAVSDGLLAKAADVMGVARREVRQAIPTAQLFVTPDQGNELASAYAEMATAPLPRGYRRRQSKAPLLVGGAVAAIALVAGLVGVGYALRNNKNAPTEPAVVKKNDPNEAPPKPADRAAKVGVNWQKIEPGERSLTAFKLADDVDQGSDGRLIRAYGNRPSSLAVALSGDGTQVIHAGRDQLGVTNLTSGEVRTFGKEGPFSHAVVSPDMGYIVTVSQERAVQCWHVESQTLRWTSNFPERVTALAITPDSQRVGVSGVGVGYLEWKLADSTEARRHPQLQANEMHFTPDGEKLLTRLGDQLELWELDEPERKGSFTAGFDIRCCAISANGKEIWAAGKGPEVRRWNALNEQPLPSYAHGRTDVHGLLPLHRATGLVLRDSVGVGLCPDQNKPSMPDVLPADFGPVASMFVTRDHRTGVFGNEKGFLLVRLVQPTKTVAKKNDPMLPVRLLKSLPLDFVPTMVEFDASGNHCVASNGTTAVVAEVSTARILGTLARKKPLHAVGFTADERLLVTEGDAVAVRTSVWDWKNNSSSILHHDEGEQLTHLRGVPNPAKPNWVLAHSPKRGQLLFDMQTSKLVAKWINTEGHVTHAVPTPDGQYIAYRYARSPVYLWDVDSQEMSRTIEGSEGVKALAFTPDGKKLVGLWPLGRLVLWSVDTGKIEQAVAHDYEGPFTGLRLLSDNLALLQRERDTVLVPFEQNKMLDMTKAPPALRTALATHAGQQRLLQVGNNTLDVWSYNAKLLIDLPEATKPEPANPDLLLVRDGPLTPVVGLECSTDGTKLVVATTQGQLLRFDRERLVLDKHSSLLEQEFRHFLRVGGSVFTINTKGDVRKWDIDRFESVSGYALGFEVLVASVKSDSEVLLVASEKQLVELNTAGRKNNTRTVSIQTVDKATITRPVANIAFNSNATTAIIRWDNGMLGLWKPGEPRLTKRLIDSEQKDVVAASCFALSPTGKYLVYGTKTGYIRLWDTSIDKKPRSEAAHRDEGKPEGVSDIVMCSTGQHCLTRGLDGRIILWNIATAKRVKEFVGTAGAGRMVLPGDEKSFIVWTAGRMEQWKMPDLAKE